VRDISLHILDIVENSVRAKADLIKISMTLDKAQDTLTVSIADNGHGMSKEMLLRVKSPFTTSRTTRNVGLGIPLFTASCEKTGGRLDITSTLDVGTTVVALYRYSHIDRPPLGDIAETIYTLTLLNPDIDFVLTVKDADNVFVYDTREIKTTLEGLPITHPNVLSFIREFLQDGIMQIFGGYEI
jgi:signal transduction histidine kinase